ncbi:DUF2499 domain-containing protein [Synechococcus elongatus]|uniref:DUF2499 domain-containing protein n=1 Tax=Synechococcus elongatus TaxID=32046 RepID=UPI000F7F0471|nr:DUF2499 domain-containing protein [Synechococcus elongatus]
MHALSLPTWVIHISSVLEWLLAILYLWRLGEQGDRRWFGLAVAMLPALISALCACTWHYYDNTPKLEWLVTLQASTTLVGNFTLMLAAYWFWRPASKQAPASTPVPKQR